MDKPTAALMEKRARWYLKYVREEAEECINRKMTYDVERCSAEEQSLTLAFETADWMMNPGGVLHGGMLCTMFDISMGITALCVSGKFTPTVNMSVSFLSPAPNHDKLKITTHATRAGKTFVQLTAEAVSDVNGETCATATGIFYCNNQEELVFDD